MPPSAPSPPLSHDASASDGASVPESTLEDVLAFIDGLGASDAGTASSSLSATDDDAQHIPSEELLGFIDAAIANGASFFLQPLESDDVDAADTSSVSSPAPSIATVAPLQEVRAIKGARSLKYAKQKRNTYRDKMKDEIKYLRLHAVELEKKLAALRQGATLGSVADKALFDSAWKRIAANQLEYRKQSEAENEQLKHEIYQQIQMAEQARRTLGKRLASGEAHDNSMKKGRKSATTVDEEEEFAVLSKDLRTAFSRLHYVFEASRIAKMDGDRTHSVTIKMGVSDRTGEPFPYTELIDVMFTPFDCRTASRAAWLSALQVFVHHSQPNLQRVWHTKTAFAVKRVFRMSDLGDKIVRENEDAVILRSKLVVQKFFESEDRMVIVWRCVSKFEEDPSEIYADETGWATVEPAAPSNPSGCSIIRTCAHIVRQHEASVLAVDSNARDGPSVKHITDLCLSSSEDDMCGLVKTFENILLDEVNASTIIKSS
uniref:BZIP domain-containing protein n=1 Tax=Globisporangium ultimum (strain ATCC 200006 / CBS 805.95 / DAOM BR144) TaxID=431595 RepID=K3W9H3_GLOUD